MAQFRHGAIHVPAPAGVPHLGARARLTGPAPTRISWLDKCPADGDPLLNDNIGNCVAIVPFRRFQTIDANRTGIVTPIPHGAVLGRYEMNGGYVPADPNNPQTNATDNGTDTTRDALNEVAAPLLLGPGGAPRPVWWGKVGPGDAAHVAIALKAAPLSITLGLPLALQDDPESWGKRPGTGTGWDPTQGPQHRVMLGDLEDGFWTVVTWGLHTPIHPEVLALPGFVLAVDCFYEANELENLALAGADYDQMRADMAALTA